MTRVELSSAIGLALATVREHKMRSFLTILGVIIGTGTIIAVGSIIAGLDGAVTGVIRSFGTNTAIIFKFPVGLHNPHTRRSCGASRSPTKTAWRSRPLSGGRVREPYLIPKLSEPGRKSTSRATKATNCTTRTSPEPKKSYAQSGQVEMSEGRFFTDVENQHRMPVAVIGADVPRALFNGEDPIGKWIDVNGHKFEIVGVMKRPGNSFPGQDDITSICRTSPCTSCSRRPRKIC